MNYSVMLKTRPHLYLNLDTTSNAEVPLFYEKEAFCAGFTGGIDSCGLVEGVELLLSVNGDKEKLYNLIISAIRNEADPSGELKKIIGNCDSLYGAKNAGNEIHDFGAPMTTVLNVQRAFIYGWEVATYVFGKRSSCPRYLHDRSFGEDINPDEDRHIISKKAADLMALIAQ